MPKVSQTQVCSAPTSRCQTDITSSSESVIPQFLSIPQINSKMILHVPYTFPHILWAEALSTSVRGDSDKQFQEMALEQRTHFLKDLKTDGVLWNKTGLLIVSKISLLKAKGNHVYSHYKRIHVGLERWLSSPLPEDLGSISTPTWQLTTCCKSNSRGLTPSHRQNTNALKITLKNSCSLNSEFFITEPCVQLSLGFHVTL